jgi:hypothetical protein
MSRPEKDIALNFFCAAWRAADDRIGVAASGGHPKAENSHLGGTSKSGRMAQPFCVIVSALDRERLPGVPGNIRMRLTIGDRTTRS